MSQSCDHLPVTLQTGHWEPRSLRPDEGMNLARSIMVERRLTNQALRAWQMAANGDSEVALAPFFDHSLVVRDPAGRAIIEAVGLPVAARFGLMAGVPLLRDPGLGEELVAACELVALQPMPIPFETSIHDLVGAQLMVRGIALPLPAGGDPAAAVQIIISWREILSKSAARRLRTELAAALADIGMPRLNKDAFPTRIADENVTHLTKKVS